MRVDIDAVITLAKTKGWSTPELASKIGINYSYLFRILTGEKKGGAKFLGGIYHLCKNEKLNIDDYIFLD